MTRFAAHDQHDDVDRGDGDRHRNADEPVQVGPLESVDDAAKRGEGEPERELEPDHQDDEPSGVPLTGGQMEQIPDVPGHDGDDRERHQADDGEDEEERARDLVDRVCVTLRPVVRDEPVEGRRITKVENREVRDDRRRQHPETVVGRAQMPRVERQHQKTEYQLDDDRHPARADVEGDGPRLVAFGPHDGSHLDPFAKSTTRTVSIRIEMSNAMDMCFT